MRRTVADLAAEHGLAPIAASTHPFARWSAQEPTERERYQAIAKDLAGVGRRLVICGMHVHVGIEDDELRIDLINQARYFLPHLLVLSTSSPFAEGEDTGLKCYRLAAYQELPRTGLPGRFEGWDEYPQTVDLLVRNGHHRGCQQDLVGHAAVRALPDAGNAHHRRLHPARGRHVRGRAVPLHPAHAVSLRRANQTWRTYPLFLLSENRWRAQRYGVEGTLFDFGKGELVPFRDLVDELLVMLREDAEALGCIDEVEHARIILARGTSADRQVAHFQAQLGAGARREDALLSVVDHLIKETVA